MKKPLLLLSLTLSIALCGASALAQTPPTRFEQHKAKLLAHIQDRIAREQALLACVQAAQDHAALKACKRAEHAAH
jgi:hypothetical protein